VDNLVGEVGAGFIIIIILIGAVGNLSIILTICRTRRFFELQHYVLIATLACSDLLFNTTIMPFYVYTYRFNSWPETAVWENVCYLYAYLGTIFIQVSGILISAIALNRYLLIAHLRLFKRVERPIVTALIIIIAYLLAFVGIAPSLVNLKTLKVQTGCVESKIHYLQKVGRCNFSRKKARHTIVALFTIGTILPGVLMVTFYILIIISIRKSSKRVSVAQSIERVETVDHSERQASSAIDKESDPHAGREPIADSHSHPHSDSLPCTNFDPEIKGTNSSQEEEVQEYQRQRNGTKSFIIIFVFFIVYCITYLPFALVNLVDVHHSWSRNIYMITSIIWWLGSCVNPVIYGVMNGEFRGELSSKLKRRFRQFRNE